MELVRGSKASILIGIVVFRVEQGPGLGQARSNDFADVGGFYG